MPAWQAHSKAIVDYAHSRGVTVGMTVQLFDKASLQQSFTLVDASRPDDEAVMRSRLALITGPGLDNLNLSFGEFFGADPQVLVDRIDATATRSIGPSSSRSWLRISQAATRCSTRRFSWATWPRPIDRPLLPSTRRSRPRWRGSRLTRPSWRRSPTPLAGQEPFVDELVDGVEITAARARFSWAVFAAAQAFNTGAPHQAALDVAKAQLTRAQRVAGRRRLAFHAPNSQQLISDGTNPTFYDYGSLRDANTLCFWRRELAPVRNLVEQAGVAVPGCVL